MERHEQRHTLFPHPRGDALAAFPGLNDPKGYTFYDRIDFVGHSFNPALTGPLTARCICTDARVGVGGLVRAVGFLFSYPLLRAQRGQ